MNFEEVAALSVPLVPSPPKLNMEEKLEQTEEKPTLPLIPQCFSDFQHLNVLCGLPAIGIVLPLALLMLKSLVLFLAGISQNTRN